MAHADTSSGPPDHDNGGDTLLPSQVNRGSIAPPSFHGTVRRIGEPAGPGSTVVAGATDSVCPAPGGLIVRPSSVEHDARRRHTGMTAPTVARRAVPGAFGFLTSATLRPP
jgi:hypothetical protein